MAQATIAWVFLLQLPTLCQTCVSVTCHEDMMVKRYPQDLACVANQFREADIVEAGNGIYRTKVIPRR